MDKSRRSFLKGLAFAGATAAGSALPVADSSSIISCTRFTSDTFWRARPL